MKVHNKAKHPFQHSIPDEIQGVKIIEIGADEIKEIPDEIAKIWIKTGEVVEFIEPKQAKALEDENAKLKAELEKLKEPKVKKPKKATKKK